MKNSKPMEFNCDGIVLRGKLDFPEKMPEKVPLMVLLHGFTGYMEERHIIAAAQAGVEAGYAVLRVDQYGHGTSDGEFCNHNVLIWMLQAMQVIDTARSWPFVSWVCLAGHSQGGLNTILVGGMMEDRIRALIPLSPAVNIAYGARKGDFLGYSFDPQQIPESVPVWGDRVLKSNYLRAAKMLPVEYAVSQFRKPVLIVHGTQDEAVPYHYGAELKNQYANAELVTIEGDDHCYNYHLDEVTAAVKAFLLRIKEDA